MLENPKDDEKNPDEEPIVLISFDDLRKKYETPELSLSDLKERGARTESYYDVLENDDGEILITLKRIDSPMDKDYKPKFYYGGGSHGIFLKSPESTVVICDHLHPGVRKQLGKVKEILIAELRDGAITEEYMADMLYQADADDLAVSLMAWRESKKDGTPQSAYHIEMPRSVSPSGRRCVFSPPNYPLRCYVISLNEWSGSAGSVIDALTEFLNGGFDALEATGYELSHELELPEEFLDLYEVEEITWLSDEDVIIFEGVDGSGTPNKRRELAIYSLSNGASTVFDVDGGGEYEYGDEAEDGYEYEYDEEDEQ